MEFKTFVLLLPPVTRENETMQKKCRMVTTEYNSMKENYQQKVTDYKKLQKGETKDPLRECLINKRCNLIASETVCKEYEKLAELYKTETGAMHQAIEKASDVIKLFCAALNLF
jgi:hypothetical protein